MRHMAVFVMAPLPPVPMVAWTSQPKQPAESVHLTPRGRVDSGCHDPLPCWRCPGSMVVHSTTPSVDRPESHSPSDWTRRRCPGGQDLSLRGVVQETVMN